MMLNKLNTLICRIFGHKEAGAHQTQPRKRRVRSVTDTIPLKFGSELRKQKSYWAPEEEWWYLYVNGEEMRPLTQFEAELVDMDTSVESTQEEVYAPALETKTVERYLTIFKDGTTGQYYAAPFLHEELTKASKYARNMTEYQINKTCVARLKLAFIEGRFDDI